MKLLIAGLGYAGTRFLHAFQSLAGDLEIAYLDPKIHRPDLLRFETASEALATFQPDVVILSMNDVFRFESLAEFSGYEGFIICEKPLICPTDDLEEARRNLSRAKGFALDLVERYSLATLRLRSFVQIEGLELVKANFTWGKDRIGDHRPTCGVTSEIIHALDLVPFIARIPPQYDIVSGHGSRSDFSISGDAVVDSISIMARLGKASVLGYASFVNPARRREVGMIFSKPNSGLIYANLQYDDPAWDCDHLEVWRYEGSVRKMLLEMHTTEQEPTASGLTGIAKLVRLASDVKALLDGKVPVVPVAKLEASCAMQATLNEIDGLVGHENVVQFSKHGPIARAVEESNWESLG